MRFLKFLPPWLGECQSWRTNFLIRNFYCRNTEEEMSFTINHFSDRKGDTSTYFTTFLAGWKSTQSNKNMKGQVFSGGPMFQNSNRGNQQSNGWQERASLSIQIHCFFLNHSNNLQTWRHEAFDNQGMVFCDRNMCFITILANRLVVLCLLFGPCLKHAVCSLKLDWETISLVNGGLQCVLQW